MTPFWHDDWLSVYQGDRANWDHLFGSCSDPGDSPWWVGEAENMVAAIDSSPEAKAALAAWLLPRYDCNGLGGAFAGPAECGVAGYHPPHNYPYPADGYQGDTTWPSRATQPPDTEEPE
jgi:hypothetical protein